MTFEQQQEIVARAQRARAEAILALAGAAARALHALGERTLKDIGVRRSQISSMVR